MSVCNRIVYFSFLVLLPFICQAQPEQAWQPLINGETLDGWMQRGGDANYYVQDGVIIGEAVLQTPNSFLTTKQSFEDFILEFEVKVDKGLNSGVQFRSNSMEAYRDRRVHGYQVEIDPDDPKQSGGIYDEARRGWLYNRPDVANTRPIRFNPGEWNTFRVEAVGDSIRTWVNGVPAAHLVDNMTSSGFIGLQVHGIGNNTSKKGLKVRWRNIRIVTDSTARRYSQSSPLKARTHLYNHLTDQEKSEGWRLLFNGNSAHQWRKANGNRFPEDQWLIHNAALTVLGKGEGSIVTKEKFKDFELSLEFRLSPGANSGIKYYVIENEGTSYGLEYQLLDDKRHPDAKRGRHGNRKLASLYDILPARDTEPRSVGEWNSARIIARDNHVEHWLNGKKVLEYNRGSEQFRQLIEESKYSQSRFDVYGTNFGEAKRGYILLQDHGDRVSFRNIKIRTFE